MEEEDRAAVRVAVLGVAEPAAVSEAHDVVFGAQVVIFASRLATANLAGARSNTISPRGD